MVTQERPLLAADMLDQLKAAGKTKEPDVVGGLQPIPQMYFVYNDGSILRWSSANQEWQAFTDNASLDWAVALHQA